MNKPVSMPANRQWKYRLLSTCAVAGLPIALSLATPASAQWAATPQGTLPTNITIDPPSGTITNVRIDSGSSPEAIINWTPTDLSGTGSVNLLPSGSTLNFYDIATSASGDYTILNRIVDSSGGAFSRLVEINGEVNSFRDTSSTVANGGSIWFQNAGGILVGTSGVFNVGALILTSREINTAGGLFSGTGAIRFDNNGSGGPVTNRGTINADRGFGSNYLALVAPRVEQSGTAISTGSIAYIAAESAELTINNGLFDINMLVGADGGTVIDHSGTTRANGAQNTANVYMAALAKNTAITLLVGGTVDSLSALSTPDGNITLSAGYNIANGAIANSATTGNQDNITLASGTFTTDLTAKARGIISADLAAGDALSFTNAVLDADTAIDIVSAGTITSNDLTMLSNGLGAASGRADVTLTGGSLTTTGALTIDVSHFGDPTTGIATGGTANIILSNDASLSAQNIDVQAGAYANDSVNAGGGSANGGTILFQTLGTSAVTANEIALDASAFSARSDIDGAEAIGGNVSLLLGGQSLLTDRVAITASGEGSGGAGESPGGQSTGAGGTGRGGNITVSLGAALADESIYLFANASGYGGMGGASVGPLNTGAGGAAFGGTINVTDARAGAQTALTLDLQATASGGRAGYLEGSLPATAGGTTGGVGGAGLGGSVFITLSGEYDDGVIFVNSSGTGGDARNHMVGADGGIGQGGIASLTALNTGLNLVELNMTATGSGGEGGGSNIGNGGNGGAGIGGLTEVVVRGAGAEMSFVPTDLLSAGFGGRGGAGDGDDPAIVSNGGRGGDAVGGILRLQADDQAVLTLIQSGSPSLNFTNQAYNGAGGSSFAYAGGDSGNATGGAIEFVANGGTIATTANVSLVTDIIRDAPGTGVTDGAEGIYTGGRILLSATANGSLDFADVAMVADGQNAGRIAITAASGGTISVGALSASAAGDALPSNGGTASSPSGIVLQADNAAITANLIDLNTGGSVGILGAGNGTITSAGDFIVNAADQIELLHSAPTGTNPSVSAGFLSLTAGTNIVGGAGSTIAGNMMVMLSAGTGIDIGGVQSDGSIQMNAGDGALRVADLRTPSQIVARGNSVTIGSGGNLNFERLEAYTGDIDVNAAGNLIISSADAAGAIRATSAGQMLLMNGGAGGDVDLTAQNLIVSGSNAAGNMTLNGAQNISLTESDIGGTLTAVSTGTLNVEYAGVTGAASLTAAGMTIEALTVDDTLTVNSSENAVINASRAGGNFTAGATGTLAVTNSTADGNMALTAAGLTVSTSNSVGTMTLNSSQNLDINEINSGGLLTATATGTLSAQNVASDANATFSAQQLSVTNANIGGDMSASGSASLLISGSDVGGAFTGTSNGAATVRNALTARSIAFTSSDIIIEAGSQLAAVGPNAAITLTNNNAALPTYIGGVNPPAGGGYHLDAAEMRAVTNSSLRVIAPNVAGNALPDLVIGAFALNAANLGDAGQVSFETTGRILVNGAADLNDVSANNGFTLIAGEALDIVMGQGALRVGDTAGDPTGTITLTAPRITMATEAARAELASLTTINQMENRLAQNDGVAADNVGLLSGTINANVTTGFFAQNSGDGTEAMDRRGVTFGAGGLNFTTAANSIIVANGTQVTSNGTLTGGAAIAGITINGNAPSAASSFNPQSMMNNCVIINPTSCGAVEVVPASLPIPPIQDIVQEPVTKDDEEVENDDREASSIPDTLISMRDLDVQTGEPLVDDPATGAGNDDLWGPVTD